jgi:hypothetical protein
MFCLPGKEANLIYDISLWLYMYDVACLTILQNFFYWKLYFTLPEFSFYSGRDVFCHIKVKIEVVADSCVRLIVADNCVRLIVSFSAVVLILFLNCFLEFVLII